MQVRKILIATGLFPPEIGGPATYSKLLLEELPSRGFEVSVLPFSEVRKIPKVLRHIVYFFKVLWIGRKMDIIYAQDPVSVGFPAMLASKALKKKFVLKIVGDYAWEQGVLKYSIKENLDEFWDHNKYPFKIRILKRVEKFVANKSGKIIVPSFYLKKIVSKWGIDKNKIKVIYNSFDVPIINESKEELRKKFNITGKTIISAGRLVPWKGFEEVIKTVNSLKNDLPDIKLFIAGDGPKMRDLVSLVSELGLDERVIFLGRVERDEFLRRIKASDIFVLNTAYEGFSHIILESLSQGVPTVVTQVGGNVEIVKNGENGFLFEKDNVEQLKHILRKIFSDFSIYNNISQSAVLSVNKFSTEEMIRILVEELCN